MKPSKLVQGLGLSLTCLSLALPPTTLSAAETAVAKSTTPAPAAKDVALGEGGMLAGQVVNPQGVAMADATVAVWHQNRTVASTKTDASGRFAITGLREGAHYVEAGDQVAVCRFWKSATAPPAAQSKVLMVANSTVARGQGGGGGGTVLMLGALGGIVAGGVISQENDGHHGSP